MPSEEDGNENEKEESKEMTAGISPLWNQDGWSLTWPIWHLLPLHERKKLAQQHGYKTIGAFEEYMSLHEAMDVSEEHKPYSSERIYSGEWDPKKQVEAGQEDLEPSATKEGFDEEEEESDNDEKAGLEKQGSIDTEDMSYYELLELGGQILMLHDELLHQVFAWLPVDAYATLALVSPHWKHLTRTEAVYRRLCERLYLNQSKRRQLHVSRFGGLYRNMLKQRPRVRAAGGCYVLKYAKIKQIQRDMWTEVSGALPCCSIISCCSSFLSPPTSLTLLVFYSGPGGCCPGKYLLPLLVFSRRWSSLVCTDICSTARNVSSST